MGLLFELEIPPNTEPAQDVDITTTILYMSTKELKEFKQLCKEGMKKLWPNTFQEQGNLPDLLLHLLRTYNIT